MNIRVLCVDDEAAIRKLFGTAFERFDFIVETAPDAEKAFTIFSGKKFHAAVVDMRLPGMDGIELCKLIRARDKEIFLTAVTGHPTKFEFSDCRKAGFDAYFTKPLSFKQLGEAIKEGVANKITADVRK